MVWNIKVVFLFFQICDRQGLGEGSYYQKGCYIFSGFGWQEQLKMICENKCGFVSDWILESLVENRELEKRLESGIFSIEIS